MRTLKIDERDLKNVLKDLSENKILKDEIITAWNAGHNEIVKSRLLMLRAFTLENVHEKQNELYCIDFILRKLK